MALSGGQPASKPGPSATAKVRLLHLPHGHLPLAQRTERLGPNETDPGSSPGREADGTTRVRLWVGSRPFTSGKWVRVPHARPLHFGVVQRQDAGLLTPLWQFESARRSETGTVSRRAAAQLVVETCLMNRPWWVRSPRGARPCSSMEERLPYKQDGGGSNPSAGTVTVVYRRCMPDRDSGGPGSTPGGHPMWVRHRW
jgi:hypothetical protein